MIVGLGVAEVDLARIARAHGVRRLQVFGSAVRADFDPDRSDIDLLVEFGPNVDDTFDAYFGLKEDLERAFGRAVDLVMITAVTNPHFRERALSTAQDLYAA